MIRMALLLFSTTVCKIHGMLELVTTKNGDIVGRPSLVIDFGFLHSR